MMHLDSVDSQWYSIWPHLLDHVRLLFQCGKTLESITEVFSIALGIDKAEVCACNCVNAIFHASFQSIIV